MDTIPRNDQQLSTPTEDRFGIEVAATDSAAAVVAMMNSLLEDVGDDEDHPLSSLLDLVSDLVSRYEQEHHAIEPAHPKDNLRFLMEARGLKQKALSSLVAQSNLSAILAGKREISATLAGKLGKFFGISPAVFLSG